MELDKVLKESVDNVADNLFRSVTNSVSEVKAMQQRKAAENVQIVVKALKKIESDLQDKYDGITSVIEKRVSTIKDGHDGKDGKNGRDGKDGRNGKDGFVGQRGATGLDGRDGVDGQDGVSVIDANIDFDGSLIISLSNGRVINVGEVVAPDLAERIKVITNGGGTSQGVLDAIAALQATIATYGTMALQNANAVAITGGTIDGAFLNNGFRENISGQYYNLVSQADIGTAPNEIPLNQYLGALAYEDTEIPALNVGTGITTGTGTICKANGGLSGGVYKVTIVIDLTGLNSGGTAGDIIGVNGTALPCYIAQLPAMTVLGGQMTCLETPAGGDTDIDLYSATEGTGVEDSAITALTETQIINAGAQTRGTLTYFSADPATNAYFYLVGQGTANATYTAGRFLIEIFGVQ
jgi:hypothetical protein